MAKTTIEFGDEATEELGRLASTLQTSKADILRNALSLYSYVYSQVGKQPGKELGIVNEGKQVEKVIVVPGLQFVRPSTDKVTTPEAPAQTTSSSSSYRTGSSGA